VFTTSIMRAAGLIVLAVATLFAVEAAADSWDKPRTFKAKHILTPEELTGEHHEVANKVSIDHFYFAFTLHSDFGDLEPVGLYLLDKRIYELAALEALNEVSKTDVFLDAAGDSLQATGAGIVELAKHPKKTVKGIGAGIKRLGMRIGRRTTKVVDNIQGDDEEEEEEEEESESAAEETKNVANATLGVNEAARMWARELQVDPYSRNPILQKALIDIGQIASAGGMASNAAGSIVSMVVVPNPTTTAAHSMGADLVWSVDPDVLRKTNEAGLQALGVSEEISAQFFRNEAFTLTDQTRFVSALTTVKSNGLADYVDTAALAKNPREALFFVESAEMLERQHGQTPVEEVLTDSRAMVALSQGRAVLLLPFDYLARTEGAAEDLAEIAARARQELGATELQMQIAGQVSKRARKNLPKLGWSLTEYVSP
jgi:hypothetical protein